MAHANKLLFRASKYGAPRRAGVRERIEYLTHQAEELIAEKRRRIEEQLWAIHEADIGDFFETHEIDGKTIERPKRLSDLPPEIRKNIEKITIDGRGHAVPQLYSKLLRAKNCARCSTLAALTTATT